MKRAAFAALLLGAALFAVGVPCPAQSQDAGASPPGIREGSWEGSLSLRQNAPGQDSPLGASPNGQTKGSPPNSANSLASGMRLKILGKGSGALMDIPEQSMFGYPLDDVSWDGGRIRFTLDALGPGEELSFDGFYSAQAAAVGFGGAKSTVSGASGAIVGTAKSTSWRGTFVISRIDAPSGPGESSLDIRTDDGILPGTLLMPAGGQSEVPLVLLLAGAGTTDRNGNNYNVPGRSDCLALLAKGLAAKGVATYRYDKRGSGEAYMLERKGKTTSLTVHASDVARALETLGTLKGVSRILVAGMNEGAWTGAAAINALGAGKVAVDGLVVLDTSGASPLADLKSSLGELDEATKNEAENIIQAILAGKEYPPPSAQLADFFSASREEWLKSWLSFQPSAEVAKVSTPVLFVYGSADLQVSKAAFERLLEARPGAAARIIPSMNYALKQVKTEEENYESFTNPGYPLPQGLVDLVAAFAKAKPLPAGSLPYQRD